MVSRGADCRRHSCDSFIDPHGLAIKLLRRLPAPDILRENWLGFRRACQTIADIFGAFCSLGSGFLDRVTGADNSSDARKDELFWLAAGPLLLASAYLVWVGGDHMPGARFVVPLLPFSILAIIVLCRNILSAKNAGAAGLGAVSITVVFAVLQPSKNMDNAAYFGTMAAERINESWPKNSLIALNTAGSTPFLADDMRYIDMLGLNDATIAHRQNVPILAAAPYQQLPGHAKGDGAYVMSRKPDFIIAGSALGTRLSSPWFLSDVEITQIPEFKDCYEHVIETLYTSPELRWRNPDLVPEREFIFFRRVCE